MSGNRRLPSWLKMERASGESYTMVKRLVEDNRLHTICTSGNCPNIGECWNAGTATLMILGDICTRTCKFCGTRSGKPLPPERDEPMRVALAVRTMKLRHCVITSVDRDDLPDGGAAHWAETIARIREVNPGVTIETLIPDFRGRTADIDMVIDAGPDVISHNIETVRRLTPVIRSVAKYEVSLAVLRYIVSRGARAKSGLMLGLGEKEEEILEALNDLYATGCRIVTIGQYLAPSLAHIPVVEYITPEKFEEYRRQAIQMGFEFAESSPLVRSSFHAEKHIRPSDTRIGSTGNDGREVKRGSSREEPGGASVSSGLNPATSCSVARTGPAEAEPLRTSLNQPDGHHTRVILDDLGRRDYKEIWDYQELFFNAKVAEKLNGTAEGNRTADRLIFVEHNHVYTLGKSGSEQNLLLDYIQLQARDAAFYRIDRGGDITYHGPGQLVGYPIFDLEGMRIGLRDYISMLEEAIIRCLRRFGTEGGRLNGATGVWIEPETSTRARKICAIGVRASRHVTMHGFALNVSTDLSYFNHINPCGFTDKGVTSIEKETGAKVDMDLVKTEMRNSMREVFGYEYY